MLGFSSLNDITGGIGYAACALASSLNAKAIIVTTNSGKSAQSICRFKPKSTIVALTPNIKIYYRLGMFWGVQPLMDKKFFSADELLKSARDKTKQFKLASVGDLVIQTAGIVANGTGSDMLVVSQID